MTSERICLGVILVIALIIIAHFARRYWKGRRGRPGSACSTPPRPCARKAAGELFAALKGLVALGRSFEDQAAGLVGASEPTRACAEAPRQSAARLVEFLSRAARGLSKTAPSNANYLAIYRGLSCTDGTLLAAADAYVEAGRTMGLSAPNMHAASMSNVLMGMGGQLRQVVRMVHRLGVALDLE